MKGNKGKMIVAEKGITLIALVVTIIILLILAGVTLNLVLNNNGLIGKAKQGVAKYQEASLNEQFELDKGTEIIDDIMQPGPSIKDKDGKVIPKNEIPDYYGDKVTYNNNEYQLFYYDKEGKFGDAGRIYLQSKTSVKITKLSDHFEVTGLTDTNSLIYKLNPDWANLVGNSLINLEESELNDNIKGVAYLCNTANWNDTYVTTEDQTKGVWAIGGASVEMFCESYNARVQPSTEWSAKAYSENSTTGYRYKPVGSSNGNEDGYGFITYDRMISISRGYEGMYSLTGICSYLTSPSSASKVAVCMVNGNGAGLVTTSTDTYEPYEDVRVLVSLPSDFEIQLQ